MLQGASHCCCGLGCDCAIHCIIEAGEVSNQLVCEYNACMSTFGTVWGDCSEVWSDWIRLLAWFTLRKHLWRQQPRFRFWVPGVWVRLFILPLCCLTGEHRRTIASSLTLPLLALNHISMPTLKFLVCKDTTPITRSIWSSGLLCWLCDSCIHSSSFILELDLFTLFHDSVNQAQNMHDINFGGLMGWVLCHSCHTLRPWDLLGLIECAVIWEERRWASLAGLGRCRSSKLRHLFCALLLILLRLLCCISCFVLWELELLDRIRGISIDCWADWRHWSQRSRWFCTRMGISRQLLCVVIASTRRRILWN